MAGVSDAKVLVMGVTGMLGHKLYQVLSRDMRVYGTMRGPHSRLNGFSGGGDIIEGVNAVMPETVTKVLDTVKPTVVVNCIGVVKQSPVCKDRFTTLWVNALFPPRALRSLPRKGYPAHTYKYGLCILRGERQLHRRGYGRRTG